MRLVAVALLLAACALPIGGCVDAAPPGVLHRAEDLGAERDWGAAKQLVKTYLIDHPEDASAHMLLGESYLHGNPPFLTLAQGEFRTAVSLYARMKERGQGKRFESDSVFLTINHKP